MALTTLLVLSACSGGNDAAKVDPCTLISSAEVQEITGGTVSEPKPGTLEDRQCGFVAQQGEETITVAIDVQTDPPTDKKEFDQTHKDDEPAEGLGDAAYFVSGSEGGGVQILTGSTQISVSFSVPEGIDPTQVQSGAQTLGKKALERYKAAAATK